MPFLQIENSEDLTIIIPISMASSQIFVDQFFQNFMDIFQSNFENFP